MTAKTIVSKFVLAANTRLIKRINSKCSQKQTILILVFYKIQIAMTLIIMKTDRTEEIRLKKV